MILLSFVLPIIFLVTIVFDNIKKYNYSGVNCCMLSCTRNIECQIKKKTVGSPLNGVVSRPIGETAERKSFLYLDEVVGKLVGKLVGKVTERLSSFLCQLWLARFWQ